jgi:hypothetical protein
MPAALLSTAAVAGVFVLVGILVIGSIVLALRRPR